jgi:glutamyl-tRNA synthetase
MVRAAAMSPRVRFAPSPSGYLHIGGARTALFNWLWARRHGGAFILRVEDTDQERSSLESVRAVIDALRWLGLDWDEGPEVGGPYGSYFQSERKALYRQMTERLIAEGKAYRCDMTREELAALREEFQARHPKGRFVYQGPYRDREVPADAPHVVRFRSPREGTTVFADKVFGTVSTPNVEQPDFVILRSDGTPLYNFAAVVDDHHMGVTLVARGRDHLGSTPPQVLLYRALGWEPPEFAHLPMMLSPGGEKLSKRHAAVAVQDYRDRGYTAMGVLNYLVRFGWSYGDREIFSRDELVALFDWDRVGKSDGKFDEKKFADVAFEHLKRPDLTSTEDYARGVVPFLAARGLPDVEPSTLGPAVATVRERARTLVEAADHLDFYLREPPEMDEAAAAKLLTPDVAPRLERLGEVCAAVEPFSPEGIEDAVRVWTEQEGLKMKDFAQAARIALTGRKASPGLFDVMSVLGVERVRARLARAAERARGARR